MDGGIGVDAVEKEKILRDARNKFICYIYSTGSPVWTQLSRTSHAISLPTTICIGKLDLHNKF